MPTKTTADDRLDRELVTLAAVLLVGAVAALLDTTVVSVALPRLSDEMGAPVATVQWVSTGYLLAMAVAIPAMGWLVDRLGARRTWLAALWCFLVGSLLCGAAWSVESLIAFRVLKGLGAGLVLPLVQAILAGAAGPARVGRVMAVVGIPGQLAPVVGPVVGGAVLSSLGWRWLFLVNVPVVAVALVAAHRHLPDTGRRVPTRLDLPGLALAAPGLAALLAGLAAAGRSADPADAPVVAATATGAALLAGFVLHARRRRERALLDVRLLRVGRFGAATASLFLFGVSLYGPLLVLPLFYERVHGATPDAVGWLLAPQGLDTMVGLWVAGRATDRVGARPVALAGTALVALATLPFRAAGPETPLAWLAAASAVRGAGLGAAGVAVLGGAYRDVPEPAVPRATSLLHVVQRIGASFGTAAMAVVLQRGLAAAGGDAPAEVAGAFRTAFGWSVGLALAALVPALALPRRPPPPASEVGRDLPGEQVLALDPAGLDPEQRREPVEVRHDL